MTPTAELKNDKSLETGRSTLVPLAEQGRPSGYNPTVDNTQTVVLLIEVGVIALGALLRILGQRG